MILVAGAGALGSSIALALAQTGAEVVLADPAAPGDNASGVAAGMLAPAFESVLDPVSADHFDLLRHARDLWPGFAARLGGRDIGLRRSGALWVGSGGISDPQQTALESALRARGAVVGVRSDGLFTPEDWRLEPSLALVALRDAARAAGAEPIAAGLIDVENGRARLTNDRSILVDQVVLAIGANSADLAPEASNLAPITGQILLFPNADGSGSYPTRRWSGGYCVDAARGTLVGATMEPGRFADPVAARALHAAVIARFPELSGVAPTILSGIRAATPDGLPMVGPSSRPGVFLAVGARRNGWLLAPLVAEMTAAYLAGGDLGGYAPAFDPRRFDKPGQN